MTIEDYEEAFALWNEIPMMGLRSLDDSYEGISKFLLRNPDTNFIAQINHRTVGVILSGHDGRRAFIYHMAVKEGARRKGIGKQLVEVTLKALKNQGINKVALVSFSNNKLGNQFWESMGFSERDDLVYRNKSINDDNI